MDISDLPFSAGGWLMPAEAAAILKVHRRTVSVWANTGRITGVQFTMGGHRRYDETEIRRLAAALRAAA